VLPIAPDRAKRKAKQIDLLYIITSFKKVKTLIIYENCQFPIADLALKKENLKLKLANRKSKYYLLPSKAQKTT
jgi:hypothetical protein